MEVCAMKQSEYIEAFLSFLRSTEQEYTAATDEEALADLRTQDLLHRLELYDDTYRETAKLGQLLRTVRKDRRTAKDTVELSRPVSNWVSDNRAIVKSLERLLGEVRKVEAYQEKRLYIPKTDILDEVLKDG